jgi:sugar O-acyltransferase (sialic acid O-acetyltransferase NeuD family)
MANQSQAVVVHRGGSRSDLAPGTFGASMGFTVAAYVDDRAEPGASLDGIPIVSFELWLAQLRDLPSIVTELDPAARRDIAARIAGAGGTFATMRRPGNAVAPSVTFGEGTVVEDGPLYIMSLTSIGRHVVVMTPVSIGHDCVIGDFVTIHPSATISGYVAIEEGVTVGVGAVIVNGLPARPLRVGRGTQIAAAAVVTKSVPAGSIITGNPGRLQPAPLGHRA